MRAAEAIRVLQYHLNFGRGWIVQWDLRGGGLPELVRRTRRAALDGQPMAAVPTYEGGGRLDDFGELLACQPQGGHFQNRLMGGD